MVHTKDKNNDWQPEKFSILHAKVRGGGQKAADFSITTREARAWEALQVEGNWHAKLSIQEQHQGMKVTQGTLKCKKTRLISNRPALKEMTEEVLQIERKWYQMKCRALEVEGKEM